MGKCCCNYSRRGSSLGYVNGSGLRKEGKDLRGVMKGRKVSMLEKESIGKNEFMKIYIWLSVVV